MEELTMDFSSAEPLRCGESEHALVRMLDDAHRGTRRAVKLESTLCNYNIICWLVWRFVLNGTVE